MPDYFFTVMVGIENTSKTFTLAIIYMASEITQSFEFAGACLTDLCFFDCVESELIAGDFSADLGAVIRLMSLEHMKDLEVALDRVDAAGGLKQLL